MKLVSKVTEIYCIADDFCKEYNLELLLSGKFQNCTKNLPEAL